MKKILFTIGIIIVLALIGGWGYLLIYGAPENMQELGADFRSAEPVATPQEPQTTDDVQTTVSVNAPLSQITTRLVAGATFLERNGSEYIRYVERGTGHTFEISLSNGSAQRLTNTTIPRTVTAIWANTGNRVVLTTERSGGRAGDVLIGTLTRNDSGITTLETEELTAGAENIAFHNQGDAFYYSVREDGGTAGYLYDLKTGEQTRVFAVPFVDLTVLWDTADTENHHIYTDPTHDFDGFLYEVTGVGLRKLAAGRGLMAGTISDTQFFVSYATDVNIISEVRSTTGTTALAIAAFPEKCDAINTETLWCAAPLQLPNGTYPDEWYQGTRTLNDRIWAIDLASNEAVLEVDPEQQARTTLDVTSLALNPNGGQLLFIDKNSGTLWLATY